MGIQLFIKRHQVLIYYILTFAISWGGLLLVGGRGFFAGTNWRTDPLFLVAVQAMLAGPPVAGILSISLFSKKAGLRELLSRLLRWRVGGKWYMIALLSAPLVQMVVLFTLSLISSVFLPSIIMATDKTPLLLSGVAIGLVGGLMEELGWTGFVIPRLRMRYSVLAVGLIVGVLWGAWHLLQMWWVGSNSFGDLLPVLFLIPYFLLAIAQLTAFRVLMVWVYDHTESLLVAILMHASYIFSTLFVLAPPTVGRPFLIYSGVFTIVLWLLVAVVAMTNGRQLVRKHVQ